MLDVDEAECTTGSGMPDDKTGESNPQPIGIRNDASRHEDRSGHGQPQLKWTAGAGRGTVTIGKYAKSTDRLKPIVLHGLERVDALDAFAAVQNAFGIISLDYRTFRHMLNQYGDIVMYVPGPQLALLTDGGKKRNLRVSSARDLHGYSDQVEVRELTILDAMKRVGTHIPIPPPTKMDSTPYRSTGILMSGRCPLVALCAAPPFCPGKVFVSLWGPELQCEFGGAVLLPLEVPEIDAEFSELFAKHSIWSLVSVFGSGSSTQGTAEPVSDAQWESACQQVEIFVKQSSGLASDAPSWVRSSIAKSKCVSRAREKSGQFEIGQLCSHIQHSADFAKWLGYFDCHWRAVSHGTHNAANFTQSASIVWESEQCRRRRGYWTAVVSYMRPLTQKWASSYFFGWLFVGPHRCE